MKICCLSTKNAVNDLSRHKKYNEKQARHNRKCTEPVFTILKYIRLFKNLRQYVLTKPLPFSKPAYIFAEIQPRYQRYL